MIDSSDPDRWVIDQLTEFAATWTGFSNEAILPEAIRRAVRLTLAEGGSTKELLEQAAHGDSHLRHVLQQAVSVGETYFFRHPDHFQFIATQMIPDHLASGGVSFRAWSAGCATGEEAYSIAALLAGSTDGRLQVEVLGTDLLERNVNTARQGIYKPWSIRPSGPILYPTFHALGDGRVAVNDPLKSIARFEARNLLDPPPIDNGPFDLVFCRNVLVYFSLPAVQKVCANLASALSPEGVLMFGTMDVQGPIPGTTRIGPPEMQMFARTGSRRAAVSGRAPTKTLKPQARRRGEPLPAPAAPPPARTATPVPPSRGKSRAPSHGPRALTPAPIAQPEAVPTAAAAPATPDRPSEPIALHLRALVHVERGERKTAETILADLCKKAPDYLPGLLERALLHIRNGERNAAIDLMRQVFRRAGKLPPEQTVPGPEPLPVGFYSASAQAFLRRQGINP